MKRKIDKIFDFLYKNIGIVIYILIWMVIVGAFWIMVSGSGRFGYILITIYLILPVSSFAVSVFYGLGERRMKYILPVVCGILQILAGFLTFLLANIISTGEWNSSNAPDLQLGLYSFLPALLGLGVGTLIRYFWTRRKTKLLSGQQE